MSQAKNIKEVIDSLNEKKMINLIIGNYQIIFKKKFCLIINKLLILMKKVE